MFVGRKEFHFHRNFIAFTIHLPFPIHRPIIASENIHFQLDHCLGGTIVFAIAFPFSEISFNRYKKKKERIEFEYT